MTPTVELLATRYAKAFIHVYESQLTPERFEALHNAVVWYDANRSQFFYLHLASMSSEAKQHILLEFLKRFGLEAVARPLVVLLGSHNRLSLLFHVLRQIVAVFYAEHNVVDVAFMTAQALSDEQIASMKKFLEKSTGKQIRPTVMIKPELIAGVRLQSETFLWEYSVAQQLRAIQALQVRSI